jgi:hypothetical protein
LKIKGIIWLEEIIDKLCWKHHVSVNEVKQLLENNPQFFFVEKGHHQGENVYTALGQTQAGRYLTVFFVYKNHQQALVVSARDMTKAERRKYERHH